jgi:hypothetical protein
MPGSSRAESERAAAEVAPRAGGCRCARLRYAVSGEPSTVFNCHCRFCRQVHGAAFTTVAIFARDAFQWAAASREPARFVTPLGSVRHFCGACASPICNHPREPGIVCLVIASLDVELASPPWAHVNTESKATWLEIGDTIPQFATFPSPSEMEMLVRRNRPRGE